VTQMKHWQDRGEVQDSDDEELSLGQDSQSHEQARKRPRLNDDKPESQDLSRSVLQELQGLPSLADEPDEVWIQPRVATTYGKKTGLARIARGESQHEAQRCESNSCAPSRSILSQPRVPEAHPLQPEHGSQQISDCAEQIPVGAAHQRPSTPQAQSPAGGSSGLSSPLSEHELSPPIAFGSPRIIVTTRDGEGAVARSEHAEDIDHVPADQSPADTEAHQGRRSLRARTEKQLHPFLYERKLHQQEWRLRGLRPLHFNPRDKRTPVVRDESYNTDESESQHVNIQSSSSPAPPNPPLVAPPELPDETNVQSTTDASLPGSPKHAGSDYEFPDIDAILNRRVPRVEQNGRKRRRIGQTPSIGRIKASGSPRDSTGAIHATEDDFSIPPSPPPTSSDSAANSTTKVGPAIFRMPYGTTPAPLPTPQISSGVRLMHRNDTNNSESESFSPRRSRPPTALRRPPVPMIIDSSIGSSEESGPDPEHDDRRLRREQKRIRGVLPASWLKIDLRAQQRNVSPSPSPDRSSASASPSLPAATWPQRGVAQRVAGRDTATPIPHRIITVDDDSEEDSAIQSRPQPSHQSLHEKYFVDQFEPFEDERMEADVVDAMLAGRSRHPANREPRKKRQPRITDAFTRTRNQAERLPKESAVGPRNLGDKQPLDGLTRGRARAGRQRKSAPSLSVLDAPTPEGMPVPQFIRVARRQARRHTGLARHSPTRKEVRLATKQETEEADAVLIAWREGTIAPRDMPRTFPMHSHPTPKSALGDSAAHQQSLPSPLRRDMSYRASEASSALNLVSAKLQQTRLALNRLQSNSRQPQCDTSSPRIGHSPDQTRRQARRPRLQPQRYRNAQLETLADVFNDDHRTAAFERRVNILTETVSRRRRSGAPNQSLQLNRYLNHDGKPMPSSRAVPQEDMAIQLSKPSQPLPHRPRKRQAARLEVDARNYRQSNEPLPSDDLPDVPVGNPREDALQGLGPYGTRYATDFDIQPLALGTYFHESTFIGSGDFAASLQMCSRDMDVTTGRIRVHLTGEVLEWGAWTEDVAEGIARIPAAMSVALQTLRQPAAHEDDVSIVESNIDHMLRSVVRYCAKCLAFLDPVDRRSCVQHLQRLVEAVLELSVEHSAFPTLQTRCFLYAVVLASQTLLLAEHPIVEFGKRESSEELIRVAAYKLAKHVLPTGFQDLRVLYEDNRRASKREAGIRRDDTAVSAIVVLKHCLSAHTRSSNTFWAIFLEVLRTSPSHSNTVYALDRSWYDFFTILPILEIDASGISRPGTRFISTQQDWTIPRQLTERLLALYDASSAVRGSTINDYMRATFTRSFRLVSQWGWSRCEPILSNIFDFFARRNLAALRNEESRGSPRFLEELAEQPCFEVQPEDRSFHIFLKMIVMGLQGMRKTGVYTDRRIGGIAWRLIPNHGRTCPKDAEVKQTDVDTLRNHHDLLCTLYFASPPQQRLRVELLRNLVDHAVSHREACRLSVRAWGHLASFQAASSEPVETLVPLIDWFKEIVQTSVLQYRMAKTEAESDFAIAKARGITGVTEALLSSTVATNQRGIAGTLVDALAGLRRALLVAQTVPTATALLEGSAFWKVFDPFDASERRLYGALDESLSIVRAAFSVHRRSLPTPASQSTSDDSQGYGDSTALQDFIITQEVQNSVTTIPDILHEPVGRLVSNMFGADGAIDDALVTKTLDVWVEAAEATILAGKRTWNAYLDDYSSTAWQQLHDSDLKRKFTPYFLACLVERAQDHRQEIAASVLNGWLLGLVEREALLKYQHHLTESLLNYWTHEGLLKNLPFVRDLSTDRFTVTMHDFRLKRLAVISSVLSNIREEFEHTIHERPERLAACRQMYASWLRQLMQIMKSNYQELQAYNALPVANADIQGAYVYLVQQVVSFMQQYTTEICRIDPFFTDSAAFPLPATDPTYVIGRLKSYSTKLAESKTRKQLAVFVHTVSERAVVDDQQQYLIDQLRTAMAGVVDGGHIGVPTLRHVLLTTILPVYIDNALTTACSWIMALPIIEACGGAARGLLYDVRVEDRRSVDAALECVNAVATAMLHTLEHALVHRGLLGLPHAQKVLISIFEAARSSLTVCDYLHRCSPLGKAAYARMSRLHVYAPQVKSYSSGETELSEDNFMLEDLVSDHHPYADTEQFTQKQASDAFKNNWYAHEGQYFVRRGNSSVEVVVHLDEDERARLMASVDDFSESFVAIFGSRRRVRRTVAAKVCADDGVMV